MAIDQKGWKVDVNQCVGCRSCEAACKIEYGLNAGQGRRRRVIEKTVIESGVPRTFFISLSCNHCKNPACIAACPKSKTGTFAKDALYKDTAAGATQGVVKVNPDNCVGCRRCEWACPYGAPQYNPTTGKVHKCEMCHQRVANTDLHSTRQVPACQATCLGGAIKLMDVDTTPSATSTDFFKEDNSALRSGTPRDSENFVSPGTAGRGSAYLADAAMTNPGLKIRNKKYLNRNGSSLS